MRLIDGDELLNQAIEVKLEYIAREIRVVTRTQIYNAPTIEAVPMSVIDKIRTEIEHEKTGYPSSAEYYKAIMKVLQIIDKHISRKEKE